MGKKIRTAALPVILLLTILHATGQGGKPCFLVISDTHVKDTALPTGYDSETHKALWLSTLQKIKQVAAADKPSFIILLGDLPWHANRNNPSQLESAKLNSGMVLHDLRQTAQAINIPLLYTPGNNDSQDGDYAAFTAQNGQTPFYLDKGHQNQWPMISTGKAAIADTSLLPLGCYSAWPLGKKSKLRVIALNTVIFTISRKNPYSPVQGKQQSDAAAQMGWFASQLQAAAAMGDKVLIIMHVPPGRDGFANSGNNFWPPVFTYAGTTVQNSFLSLVAQYKASIIGMLSSHTHMDAIKILVDSTNAYSSFVLSVPAITPDHLNNPGIKLVYYNAAGYALTGFTTLYNPIKNNDATAWDSSYTFANQFNCPASTTIAGYLQAQLAADTALTRLKQNVFNIYMVKSPMPNVNNMSYVVKTGYQDKPVANKQ